MHFGKARRDCRLCSCGLFKYVLMRSQKVCTHCSLHGRGTWNRVVMCVESSVSGEGHDRCGVGGGCAGLSFCVRMHRGQGDKRREKDKQDLQTHLLKAVRKEEGGKSLWERCVDVMCVRRVDLE